MRIHILNDASKLLVATVLTVYGIETCLNRSNTAITIDEVATVPTACGIETIFIRLIECT